MTAIEVDDRGDPRSKSSSQPGVVSVFSCQRLIAVWADDTTEPPDAFFMHHGGLHLALALGFHKLVSLYPMLLPAAMSKSASFSEWSE
jgi:hypothetical protein